MPIAWRPAITCAAWPDRRGSSSAGPPIRRATSPYFLYATTEAQLDYLRFPLGGMPKTDVRALAEAAGLRNAAKPDSQDILLRSRR